MNKKECFKAREIVSIKLDYKFSSKDTTTRIYGTIDLTGALILEISNSKRLILVPKVDVYNQGEVNNRLEFIYDFLKRGIKDDSIFWIELGCSKMNQDKIEIFEYPVSSQSFGPR